MTILVKIVNVFESILKQFFFQFSVDLIPVKEPATFHISVSGGGAAELAVSVRGSHGNELPVRIKGDVQNGFIAEFTPTTVGAHTINVEYNGYAVQVMHINKIESYLNICIEQYSIYEITNIPHTKIHENICHLFEF